MKKYIIAFVCMFILLNCNLEVKKAKAQRRETYAFEYTEAERKGMKYGVWWKDVEGAYISRVSIAVVNLTKDELECKVLRLQLEKLEEAKKVSK